MNQSHSLSRRDFLGRSTKATALAVYTPIECIQQQCSAQWDACRKDRQCVTVLQDC